MRHLTVRTRNSKCYALRDIEVPKKTILRLGSVTPTAEITRKTDIIEINPAEACAISSDKRATRRILLEAGEVEGGRFADLDGNVKGGAQ